MEFDGEIVQDDSDSDIWDDTALVKAYDNAVQSFRVGDALNLFLYILVCRKLTILLSVTLQNQLAGNEKKKESPKYSRR